MSVMYLSGTFEELSKKAHAILDVVRRRQSAGFKLFQADEEWRYTSVGDNRVCFPAGTQITTSHGECPIEEVQLGDQVLTRKGFKKVLSTINRPYNGRMITIEYEKGTLTSTFDHPIWKIGQGWIAAFQIQVGDFLKTADDKRSRVSRVFQFSLTDPNDTPPLSDEEICLPSILARILMPISSVNFQRSPNIRNQEVNTIPPNLCLLNIFYLDGIKNLAHSLLQQGFALIFTVTRKATELAANITWFCSKFFSTIPAINILRRTPTDLTAIPMIQTLSGSKDLATPFTGNIFGVSRFTLKATNRVSIGYGAINLKRFSTFRTNLFHLLRDVSTFIGAKGLFSTPKRNNKRLSTLRAGFFNPLSSGKAITGHTTIFSLACASSICSINKFISAIITGLNYHRRTLPLKLSHSYKGYIHVYNLEIEEEPEYFANGILVHNCPFCRGFEDDNPWRGNEIPHFFPRRILEGTGVDLVVRPNVHETPGLTFLKRKCRCFMRMVDMAGTFERRLHKEKLSVV